MQLIDAKTGKSYKTIRINLPEKIKRRLQMLGMTSGTEILVLNKKFSGTMIIKIRGTRFAIGNAFAKGILVRGEDNE